VLGLEVVSLGQQFTTFRRVVVPSKRRIDWPWKWRYYNPSKRR